MKNKKTYILSGLIIAASIAILLIFLLLPGDNYRTIKPLNCSADDIELEIGAVKTDFYQISHEDAIVSFSLDQENIIEISKNQIVALKQGRVKVTIMVTWESNQVTDEFYVTVLSNAYSMCFDIEMGGAVEGDTLYLSSNNCQFMVNFYDKAGMMIEDCEIYVSTTNGATVVNRFGRFQLYTESNCLITFDVPEYNFQKVLNIIIL